MLKYISENKIRNFLESRNFLIISCALIFFFSIFLRSLIDIGADTGVYLDIGKKVSQGGRYYYDFFESNFPISFYFYSLQYQLAQLLHLSQIILSEIIINLLAFLSIFWSSQILKKTTIHDNKAHYNLIIISYFLSFFLRPFALQIGEFGTKTSLLLIALYPYLSYSFETKLKLVKKDLTWRGCLMGLIPCIKPHYLILIIFIESYQFWQKKSLRFFLKRDKLVMCLIGVFYLFLMIKFTPEFFEFMVPMWQKHYPSYDNYEAFMDNFWRHFASRISIFAFIFLAFSHLKFTANDKILALFFAGASALILLENIGTIDQIVVFYTAVTICFAKILFDLIFSKSFSLLHNKFIISALLILPLFDLEVLPDSIFGLGGFVNIWWLVVLILPFFLIKKLKLQSIAAFVKKFYIFGLVYVLLVIGAVLSLKYFGGWAHITFNLTALFVVLFFLERKIYTKFFKEFSALSVFVITTSVSCLFYSYVTSINTTLKRDSNFISPGKLSDLLTYYSKTFAPKKEDGILVVSTRIAHQFPTINYLEKENYQKFHIAMMQANKGSAKIPTMIPLADSSEVFTFSYLFDDVKNSLENPQVKILFINNTPETLIKGDRCLIGTLEYYFLDWKFKKLFFENFRFENHAMIIKDVKPVKKVRFISGEEASIFDKVQPTTKRVLYDFEIYVRKDINEN